MPTDTRPCSLPCSRAFKENRRQQKQRKGNICQIPVRLLLHLYKGFGGYHTDTFFELRQHHPLSHGKPSTKPNSPSLSAFTPILFTPLPFTRAGSSGSVIVKDLQRVLQDGVNHLALP